MQLPENGLFYRDCMARDKKNIDEYAYRLSNYIHKPLYRPEFELFKVKSEL